jgi:hypothetical protein
MKTLKKGLLTYISGGMTGYENYNYNFFDERAKNYREQGYNIITPSTDINPMLEDGTSISIEEMHQLIDAGKISENDSWKCFLRGDIDAIIKRVKQIYMLKGWLVSKGARMERYNALKMGCSIEYERNILIEILYSIKFLFVTKILKRQVKELVA